MNTPWGEADHEPEARHAGRLEERLSFYAKPKLPIIDELGYLPFDPNAAQLAKPEPLQQAVPA